MNPVTLLSFSSVLVIKDISLFDIHRKPCVLVALSPSLGRNYKIKQNNVRLKYSEFTYRLVPKCNFKFLKHQANLTDMQPRLK